jgi:putative methionine-R-sulfoxide reductase with GAF domain
VLDADSYEAGAFAEEDARGLAQVMAAVGLSASSDVVSVDAA